MGYFTNNPYINGVVSPYSSSYYSLQRPNPRLHAKSVQQTIKLNATLNTQAQAAVDGQEPTFNIWESDRLDSAMSNLTIRAALPGKTDEKELPVEEEPSQSGQNVAGPVTGEVGESSKSSRFAGLKKALTMKSSLERAATNSESMKALARQLRTAIMEEERGRWPNEEFRQIAAGYQEKIGINGKIAELRARYPTQYLHLLRAGYFEPIPVAWATLASNPLKFRIEAAAGWRGITPAWRGYEDTAEERLYWVMNHRDNSFTKRMKPDMISTIEMARTRMASAVEPPPGYYSANDTCYLQHTSEGYSRQVMPGPFVPFDAPAGATDDTMILLDVSESMDFDPLRPTYDKYLITGYSKSAQPKNKGNLGVFSLVNTT
jgi:hypothetical protein